MKLAYALALAGVLGLATAAFAADAPAKHEGLHGKVVKVDGANVVIKTGKEAKEVTVVTDAKTEVTLDGKEAKVADLKADMYVHVTPAEGTATKIEAKTPKAHEEKPK